MANRLAVYPGAEARPEADGVASEGGELPCDIEAGVEALHLRLWRAASPRSESEQRRTGSAGRQYLSQRSRDRSPTVLFDCAWYASQLPWFARETIDPLDHYLRVGWTQGLSPHPAFDAAHVARALGVKTWTEPPLLAWFEHEPEVSAHPLFDVDIYSRYVAPGERSCARLFELFIGDWAKARAPFSRLFSVFFYGKFEPVIRHGNINPLLHYLLTDVERRRNPNPMLHERWYDERYPARPGQSAHPLVRFAGVGLEEGHLPNPFAARELKLRHPDELVPRELLLEHVDVSGIDDRWHRSGGTFAVSAARAEPAAQLVPLRRRTEHRAPRTKAAWLTPVSD